MEYLSKFGSPHSKANINTFIYSFSTRGATKFYILISYSVTSLILT